ncbi:MAG TPA: glycosyltransferase family 2 protein [Verrucomicrobiae bacterium]|nr:glycosyltransferase family 2 protein [Verrucomicrobiae bacterium]
MKISLIISTYNQPEALHQVFQGVSLQDDWPAEILIADDGSAETTRRLIKEWSASARAPVQHHWHPDVGFLKTTILNKAVARATGDYLVFLDGDCVPHRKFIQDHRTLAERGFWVQGRRCFIREPFAAAFLPGRTSIARWALSGRIARPFKSVRLPFPLIRRDHGQRGILGCNMAFWRDDVVAVNGFDESYLGRGMGADSDLGSRIYNLGRGRKFVYGRALVYHLDHPIAPRPHFDHNRARLDDVLRSKRIRCERGLDQYTAGVVPNEQPVLT